MSTRLLDRPPTKTNQSYRIVNSCICL